ncbi:MAG: LysR substrate-binding domain-containing protein [Alcaligenaceae bacterium]|nr:LysR substrate-binding domain-containing protein [Alcaligenaceae bacterium]
MRKRPLPSISALQSFEAVARHLSATRAAQELHLTQSAVSKQVGQLEEILQNPLFTRIRKRLQLTPAGELYLVEVRKILNQVEMSSHYIQSYGGDTEVLAVVAPPTFASVWLIPRLVGFGKAYPHIHLNIRGESGSLDAPDEKADVEIYFGGGTRPNSQCAYLFDEKVVAVCAPGLLRPSMPSSLQQLTGLRLLQLNSRPQAWHEWFDAQDWRSNRSYHGPRFETFHMLISAATAGCGVALVPRFLVEDELANGRLAIAWPYAHTSKGAYYLAHAEHTADVPKVRALVQWISRQLAADRQPCRT